MKNLYKSKSPNIYYRKIFGDFLFLTFFNIYLHYEH